MRRLILTVVASCVFIAGMALHAEQALSPEIAFKARIAQLEGQVQALSVEGAVCRANFLIAQQQQAQPVQAQQRQAIEQEAGCVLDWTVAPPVCKSSK